MLDLNLRTELSYPVADILIERSIPFIFATAYPPIAIDDAYTHAPALQKPFEAFALQKAISAVMGSG